MVQRVTSQVAFVANPHVLASRIAQLSRKLSQIMVYFPYECAKENRWRLCSGSCCGLSRGKCRSSLLIQE